MCSKQANTDYVRKRTNFSVDTTPRNFQVKSQEITLKVNLMFVYTD